MHANHPDKLDPAFVRPGRVDFKIEFNDTRDEDILAVIPDAEIKGTVVETLVAHRQKLLKLKS